MHSRNLSRSSLRNSELKAGPILNFRTHRFYKVGVAMNTVVQKMPTWIKTEKQTNFNFFT